MRPALEGIRVLDFTILQMGAIVSMWLGDLGADVVKVEKIDGGDPVRKQLLAVDGERAAPLLAGDSPTFMALNRNKRSVALDLKRPEGKEVVYRLAERADVVLSNFRPGVMDSLGFGYEALRRINPRIIYYAGSGFGQTGPYRDKKGQDLIAQAMGGLMSITGERDGPPTAAGAYLADHVGGLYGALGVMAALFARERTGKGQVVESALLDAVIAMQPVEMAAFLNSGIDWRRGSRGTGHAPGSATYGVYQTQDISIAFVGTLARVCDVLGLQDLSKDSKFDTPRKQWERQEELRAILGAELRKRPGREWVRLFEAKDMWVGPINTFRDVVSDPQVLHNNMLVEVDHPAAGKVKLAGVPVKMSETPPGVRRHPPRLGEHTDEVLREIGYTGAQIEGLRQRKVVG